jgi:hypothetical protein
MLHKEAGIRKFTIYAPIKILISLPGMELLHFIEAHIEPGRCKVTLPESFRFICFRFVAECDAISNLNLVDDIINILEFLDSE